MTQVYVWITLWYTVTILTLYAGVKFSLVMKTKKSSDLSWGFGYAVSSDTPNRIIGNVLTLVEVLGLTEKQERPFKDLITQRVWDAFNDGISLSDETHTELRERYYKEQDEARMANRPPYSV